VYIYIYIYIHIPDTRQRLLKDANPYESDAKMHSRGLSREKETTDAR